MSEFRKEENMTRFAALLHGGPWDGHIESLTQDQRGKSLWYPDQPPEHFVGLIPGPNHHRYEAKPLKDGDPRLIDTPLALVRDDGWLPQIIMGTVHYKYQGIDDTNSG